MFGPNDDAFLTKQISENRCVLFLGAGFCWEMKNRLGARMPLGGEVAEEMWGFLGYTGGYPKNMNLAKVFDLFLKSSIPESRRRAFLEDRLLTTDVPEKYEIIGKVLWNKVYSTNVDDSLGKIFKRAGVSVLDEVVHPSHAVRERDQFLEKIQAIFLHGQLPCSPFDLTFSMRQYASRLAEFDRLYDTFVGDYSVSSVVFLGTELDEPVFYQYVEARNRRGDAERELRPRSFLISPSVNAAYSDLLKQFNIVASSGTTSDFLEWLESKFGSFPKREELIQARLPTLSSIRRISRDSVVRDRHLQAFSAAFHEVPLAVPRGSERSRFLLGSSPRWEDIHEELDATREVTQEVVLDVESALDSSSGILVYALLGSAGCGKSTILRRLGLTLAQRGRRCYLTNSEELPDIQAMVAVLEALPGKVVLLFDNAEGALSYIAKLGNALKAIENAPIIVVASRQNDYYRKFGRVTYSSNLQEKEVPDLSQQEIYRIITLLEKHNLLGRLREMTPAQRFQEFYVRSRKQILVAMREATQGLEFDEIIKNEFETLPSDESKVLYLCVALCTDAGYRVEKSEYVRFSGTSPALALDILDGPLRGMVMKTGESNSLLLLRHRRIAEFLVDYAAPRELIFEAYCRVLPVLSPSSREDGKTSRRFKLYRDLINHDSLLKRFADGVEKPRKIYDLLGKIVSDDAQYFLQYGCLEMQGGDLDFAANYITQAAALDPRNKFVVNAQGHLLLKQAVQARSLEQAIALKTEGRALLDGNSNRIGSYDAHYYSIVCEESLVWIKKWGQDVELRKAELKGLDLFIAEGRRQYPNSKELRRLEERIREEYLRAGVPS